MVLLSWLKLLQNQTDQKRTELHFQCLWKTPVHSEQRSTYLSVDEQHSSNIYLIPYILWDMSLAALTSLNHSNYRYSMSNQYPQPTTRQPKTDSYPVFSSLRTMNSKRRGLRVSFAFFQRNYLTDGRVNETVAPVEELSDANHHSKVSTSWYTSIKDEKQIRKWFEAKNDQRTARKAWRDYMVDWYLNKVDLTCDRKLLRFIDINPNGLNHKTLKIVQYVFVPVKIEELVHSMEATKMNG